jgi:hypothetical protein
MSNREENAQFNQDATTSGATSWEWTYAGPGTVTFGSPTAEDTTISADTDGSYTITLTVSDALSRTDSASFTLIWDTTAPNISIVPVSPDPTGDATPTFTGTASDSLSNIAGVEYKVDAGSWTACTASDGSFDSSSENYTCTVASALSDGSHTVYVRASDTLGNTSNGSVSDVFEVDLAGPTVSAMSNREENAQFTISTPSQNIKINKKYKQNHIRKGSSPHPCR